MEIEIKILDIDPPTLRQRLKAAGATYQGREFQRNGMYDYPDRRLYEQRDGSYARIRVRKSLDTGATEAILTLKLTVSRSGGYKRAEEHETVVADAPALDAILRGLGLEQIRVDEKIRETWLLGPVHCELDEWAGLPPYLEIEGPDETTIATALGHLGYSLADATHKNLREVLALYNVSASSLTFADLGRDPENE